MAPNKRAQPVVLVVDDEEPIRRAARRILESDGYAVIEAENGAKAIQLLEDDRRLDMLMADLDMPELTGTALMTCRQRRLDPLLAA